MWPVRHGLRVGAYAVLAVVLGNALAGTTWRMGTVLLCGLLGVGYLLRPWLRLLSTTPDWPARRWARGLGRVAVIRLLGDAAKLSGYLYGRLRRSGGRVGG